MVVEGVNQQYKREYFWDIIIEGTLVQVDPWQRRIPMYMKRKVVPNISRY
jgi:hypothetical protein